MGCAPGSKPALRISSAACGAGITAKWGGQLRGATLVSDGRGPALDRECGLSGRGRTAPEATRRVTACQTYRSSSAQTACGRPERRLSVAGRLGLVAALFTAEILPCGRLLPEAWPQIITTPRKLPSASALHQRERKRAQKRRARARARTAA